MESFHKRSTRPLDSPIPSNNGSGRSRANAHLPRRHDPGRRRRCLAAPIWNWSMAASPHVLWTPEQAAEYKAASDALHSAPHDHGNPSDENHERVTLNRLPLASGSMRIEADLDRARVRPNEHRTAAHPDWTGRGNCLRHRLSGKPLIKPAMASPVFPLPTFPRKRSSSIVSIRSCLLALCVVCVAAWVIAQEASAGRRPSGRRPADRRPPLQLRHRPAHRLQLPRRRPRARRRQPGRRAARRLERRRAEVPSGVVRRRPPADVPAAAGEAAASATPTSSPRTPRPRASSRFPAACSTRCSPRATAPRRRPTDTGHGQLRRQASSTARCSTSRSRASRREFSSTPSRA